MRIETLGSGHPEVTVVACLHGDEQSGKEAIERLLAEEPDVREPVQFVVANEEAMTAEGGPNRRIDADLNRVFPGDPGADEHERALAAEVMKRVRDTKVLDLHSTTSNPDPFTVSVNFDLRTAHLCRATGIDEVVDITYESRGGGLIEHCNGVSVECGHLGAPETVDNAYEVVTNLLAANGVLDRPFEYAADPQVYRIYDEIGVDTETGTFLAGNFGLVEAGETFARDGATPVVADEDFYPVLAADDEDSYDFLGFKAKNAGALSEYVG